MTLAIPRLRVGDSAAWTVSVPAQAGKTLRYTLAGPSSLVIGLVEGSSGEFLAAVTSTTSSAFVAGSYFWALEAIDGNDRTTLATGTVEILPDTGTVPTPFDTRTHAQRMLDAIEATLEGRITADVQVLSIRGRSVTKIPAAELLVMRDKYRAEVQRERVASGLAPARNKVFVRFAR